MLFFSFAFVPLLHLPHQGAAMGHNLAEALLGGLSFGLQFLQRLQFGGSEKWPKFSLLGWLYCQVSSPSQSYQRAARVLQNLQRAEALELPWVSARWKARLFSSVSHCRCLGRVVFNKQQPRPWGAGGERPCRPQPPAVLCARWLLGAGGLHSPAWGLHRLHGLGSSAQLNRGQVALPATGTKPSDVWSLLGVSAAPGGRSQVPSPCTAPRLFGISCLCAQFCLSCFCCVQAHP